MGSTKEPPIWLWILFIPVGIFAMAYSFYTPDAQYAVLYPPVFVLSFSVYMLYWFFVLSYSIKSSSILRFSLFFVGFFGSFFAIGGITDYLSNLYNVGLYGDLGHDF